MTYRDMATIQRNSAADGATAEVFTGTPLYVDVPCKVTAVGGDESYRGRQIEAHTSHIVELQHVDGVLPTMRLKITEGVWRDAILNITAVRPLDRGQRARKLELYCRELVDV